MNIVDNSIFFKSQLPKGWYTATIEEMIGSSGIFCDGDWVESKDQDPDGDVRLIQLADIGDGTYRNKSNRFLTFQKAEELGCTFLVKNDVLIARMPDPLGRACIFPGDYNKSVTVVDVCIVRIGQNGINNRWLMYAVNSLQIRSIISSFQSGSTRKRISRGNLSKIIIPMPPLAEQHRIVDKIEELFTKLDVGVESLKKAKVQLKQYRQAVLKNAFEGKLSDEWRKRNNDTAYSIVKKTRETNAQTKLIIKNNNVITVEPHSIPNSWTWVSGEQIFSFITSGSRGWAQYYSNEGFIFIRIGNLNHDSISLDLSSIQRVKPPDSAECRRTKVLTGDILVSITADVGMIALISGIEEECYINQHIALARPLPLINGKFIAWYLASDHGQKSLKKLQRGATKVGLGLDDIRSIRIPIASLNEQQIIVDMIESHLSIINELERTIDQNLARTETLRQSILAQSFSGKLVPQDPNDEPAGKLLERIRAERAQKVIISPNGKTKKNKKQSTLAFP